MTPTNWRELCRELISTRGPDYYRTLEHARKALADGPAAGDVAGPTDEELLVFQDEWFNAPGRTEIDVTEFQRATLARWGTPNLAETRSLLGDAPATVPVPVSERLPEPEDCDAEGRCWWWYSPVPEQTYGYWIYEDNVVPERSRLEWPDSWLPAAALPLPEGEVK